MVKRIAIIGNAGGGKTTLARRLSEIYDLPVTYVDGVQFLAGFEWRPEEERRAILNAKADETEWVIDGFGDWDVIEKRFLLADVIVFVDFPLWRHYWWTTKRQIKTFWETRAELPEGCSEKSLAHTITIFKVIWSLHRDLLPKLMKMIQDLGVQEKVVRVRSLSDWKRVYNGDGFL